MVQALGQVGFLGVTCLGYYSTSNILFLGHSDRKGFSFQPMQKKTMAYSSPNPMLAALLGTTYKVKHLCNKILLNLSF